MEYIKNIISEDARLTEERLAFLLNEDHIGDSPLADAMRYSTLGGGKRIRAALTLEFCKLFGGRSECALDFAAAIEMIQAYTLIHDDLPCMDDDDIRRGKPSCHIKFGEATALLAGDTLLTYAFEVIAGCLAVSNVAVKEAVLSLSHLIGALGTTGGQEIDLSCEASTFDELKHLHSLKTAALIKASCNLGYFAAMKGSPEQDVLSSISEYAECIGLAFQIKDDILDFEGDEAILGKKVGIDKDNGRVNALTFLSLDEAKAMCETLSSKACDVLSSFEGSKILCDIAVWLNSRNK